MQIIAETHKICDDLSNLMCGQVYTLIEQSRIYSNRTCISIHMLRELHLVEFFSLINAKTEHDLNYTAIALVCKIELQ